METSETSLDTRLVQFLDRGGLKYPTVLAVLVGYRTFCMLQVLISGENEHAFRRLHNQKSVAFALVVEVIMADDFFLSEASEPCELCGKHPMELIKLLIPRFLNVLLNNYTKKCNDLGTAGGSKKGGEGIKRKLNTEINE